MFSFIKEILNSPDHSKIFNYDETEFEEIKSISKENGLILSDKELLALHDLIYDSLIKKNSIDKNLQITYMRILEKIVDELLEREMIHGKNTRK